MLFITSLLLELYASWQLLGALRILVGLVPCLLIVGIGGLGHLYRRVRDREKIRRSAERLKEWEDNLQRILRKAEMEDPERNDFDENGIRYGFEPGRRSRGARGKDVPRGQDGKAGGAKVLVLPTAQRRKR